jgi:[glutamine synthetase] adenylyltransferase / [glutamine synthetase]-adenylyl-L-tyrosine phosphorylase
VTVAEGAGSCAAQAAPRALSDAAGRARFLAWLEEVEGTAAGSALGAIVADHPGARALLEAIASSSPYLWDLARADPERLVALLNSDPDARFARCLNRATAEMAGAVAQADAMRLLREMKAEAALLIALADIGGMWGVMRVAEALTALADTAVTLAVRHLLAGAEKTGHLAPADPERPEIGSGYVVLAMGKMGAGELNYSSDIDLIVLFDPDAPTLVHGVEPAVLFVRLTRQLVKLLQERTTQGYVFRVDLRLRPDPSSTQVAVSTPAALDYYESRGQNWERAAMIKARPCAGDIAAGQRLLAELSPFIWRKYLDFVALGDIHEMKRQIQAYRGCGEVAVEGHNVKLGRGGIREIEFFVQTQQLIAGGRHPALRGRETLATLEQLARGGWIDSDARDDLEGAYTFLRTVEHRLQMVADEQTHTLPSSPEELAAFARFMGYPDRDAFAAALLGHLGAVQRHYARLFEDAPARAAERRGLVFPPKADAPETLDKLSTMGFRQPIEVSQTVRRWLAGAPRALRGPAARTIFAELVPLLVDHIARAENPDAALVTFDRFLGNLHGGARLLSLLRQNPDLVALVASVLGTAPRLADTLAAHPQVMDALIDLSFSGALPGPEALEAALAVSLAQADSHEDFLDRVRAFGQEQMFLVGARILSGTVSAQQAGEAFAGLADTVVRAMHRRIADSFQSAHGALAGGASVVLAMGKLGGREMTASSDLDLIVVYDFDGAHPESDGTRPLHAAPYFARFTQRLVNALTTQTNYGRLYAVDMRLRPSGRSGPVATSLAAFAEYQRKEAWTWEHLALTRARVASASSPALAVEVEAVIREVLRTPRDADMVAGDVVEMRRAVAAEKGDRARWDLKNAAGGLVDIEFIAQYLELVHAAAEPAILNPSTARVLERAARLGILSVEDAEVLRPAERLYQDLGQILRLCLTGPFEPKSAGGSLLSLLARAADVPDFAALEAHLAETEERVRKCFVRILGSAP